MIDSLVSSFLAPTLVLLDSYLLLIAAYITLITIGALLYRFPASRVELQELPLIAIIIPAHNEEGQISRTVHDLLAARYPQDRRTCYVIADNCTDDTAALAASAGAVVVERANEEERGKAWALDWMLSARRDELAHYDLLSFVDADMYVDAEYLAESAQAFSDPATRVVQGRYVVANPGASFFAAMGFMSYAFVNHLRPAGRCYWGGTADLKGSGMTFRSDEILPRGWPIKTLAEDVHFGKELMLEGIRVSYAPSAIVTSDIATSSRQVTVQQRRWESGNRIARKAVLWRTVQSLLGKPSIGMLDALLDLMVPPLSVIVLLTCIGAGLSMLTGQSIVPYLGVTAAFAFAILAALAMLKTPWFVYAQVLAAPGFVVWKAILLLRSRITGAPRNWERTPRK